MLAQVHYTRWFYSFLILHLLVWTAVPIFLHGDLTFTSSHYLNWQHIFAFAYAEHPFLAPWLTTVITDIFGTVGWPIYFLGQLSVMVCFWSLWKISQHIVSDAQAVMSVVILESVYYYNISSDRFDPSILLLATWSLAALAFYRACRHKTNRAWIGAGFFGGLSMLTQYETIWLLIPMCLMTLLHPGTRAEYRKPGIYLNFLTFFIVFSPNFFWLFHHHFSPFIRKVEFWGSEQLVHNVHPVKFLLLQVAAILPMILPFSPFLFGARDRTSIGNFNQSFLCLIGAGPFILIFLYSLGMGIWISPLWAFPLFSFVGIILFAWYKPAVSYRKLKLFFFIVACVGALMVAARIYAHFT